jgi:regulation of enolase protein 1 (concanavalin A-like superfamily)
MEVKKNSLNFLFLCLIICSLPLLAVSAVEPPASADGPALRSVSEEGPAVQWQKTFGGSDWDYGQSVQQTSDGGFIIAGSTQSFGAGSDDVYLIKTDPYGNFLWQNTFGGSHEDFGSSVQQTSDGGFIIAGYTDSFGVVGDCDVYLIKTDPNGDNQWEKTFGGNDNDYGRLVQQTSDGGFIIAGGTSSFGAGSGDVYLIKTDPYGNFLWQKTFGGYGNDESFSAQQTSDGGFIIAGETSSFGAGYSYVYLIKTDPNGSLLWQKTFGGSSWDYGESVQQTSDGGFIVAGVYNSGIEGYGKVYLIKTDPNGNLLWQKTFDGNGGDSGESVQQTTDGGFIIAGTYNYYGAGYGDVYLIKTDPNGDSQWQKTFGGSDWDDGYSVQETTDGGFIIAGVTFSFGAGSGDVYLIKLCSENILLGDLNCDGRVDFDDFVILANQWFQQPTIPSADIAPAVRDNLVDFRDLAAFVEYWLEGTTP